MCFGVRAFAQCVTVDTHTSKYKRTWLTFEANAPLKSSVNALAEGPPHDISALQALSGCLQLLSVACQPEFVPGAGAYELAAGAALRARRREERRTRAWPRPWDVAVHVYQNQKMIDTICDLIEIE